MKISSQRKSGPVAEKLLERICSHVLRPGDVLPAEAKLAEQFGVSNRVVHDALESLASLGLVSVRQGMPTVVQPLSSQPLHRFLEVAMRSSKNGLREAMELRRALETETAVLAAERARPEHCAQLGEIVERMRSTYDKVDEWIEADLAFHLMLVRCADNLLLEFLTEALSSAMRRTMVVLANQTDLRDPPATIARHVAIYEAVRQKDPEAARAAMLAHFDATNPVLVAIAEDQSRIGRRTGPQS